MKRNFDQYTNGNGGGNDGNGDGVGDGGVNGDGGNGRDVKKICINKLLGIDIKQSSDKEYYLYQNKNVDKERIPETGYDSDQELMLTQELH